MNRDDASGVRPSRRVLLATGIGAVVALGVAVSPGVSTTANRSDESDFMRLSALLIPHRLNKRTGTRLMHALGVSQEPMRAHVAALLTLAADRRADKVEDFFPRATVSEKAAALAIISAWYLGVVDDLPGAQVFANNRALMFGPTSDAMTIPTYATAGPNEWGPASAALDFMPVF